MANTRKREFIGENVYDEAIRRIEYLYKRFDNIAVSFSGGKDSTAVLTLCIEVARGLGKLPVRTIFVDEEVIPATTVEYVERVQQRAEVSLEWYCLPVKHRNACSTTQPYWYCWEAKERSKWVRELPKGAITEHPTFTFGEDYQEWMPKMVAQDAGTTGLLLGLRAQESMRRLRVMLSKRNDNYIQAKAQHQRVYRAFPIYDWNTKDVWRLVNEKGIDYNRSYDYYNKTRQYNHLASQRICQPFGEEPLRSLFLYSECYPELWHKMLERVHGVATAWRYANTELYGIRVAKPDHLTWQNYYHFLLKQEPDRAIRGAVSSAVDRAIRSHYKKCSDVIHDEESHYYTGCSWKNFCIVAIRRDLKGRFLGGLAGRVKSNVL